MGEQNLTIENYPVPAAALGDLLKRVRGGEVDTSRGRQVLQRMFDMGESAEAAMRSLGIEKVDESACRAVRRTSRSQPETRGRRQSRQNASRRFVRGSGEEEKPERQSGRVKDLCLEIIARLP